MPKNASKTGKSSKTARVLSLLTDPAASLLGGSRNHKDDDATELMDEAPKSAAPGLDDAATESRIHDSLAAQEDELMGLFGKQEPSRPQLRKEEPKQPTPSAAEESAETSYLIPPQEEAQTPEPDPRTMELLSMLSNPSTLGNSAMPIQDSHRPAALDMDFAEELTAGLESPPPPPIEEPEPPAQQPAPQPVQQSYAAPQARQAAPQPAQQPAPQARQAAPQPASQPQQPYAAPQAQQPAQQSYAAPQAQSPAHAVKQKQEEFVCFNLTQALVEDKADKLMKQFGMCTCNRCRVDVTALALSNLPAKYVAMQNRDVLPLLSMYEEKYSAAVTVQVMSACRMVMNRPHHGRR